ncbi:MAG: prolipoprotein diacylglyceryl transferase, partial [Bdellovibrio sp.]
MLHDFSPYLWRIQGDFGVQWNGLAFVLAFVQSYFFILWMNSKQVGTGMKKDLVGGFVTDCAVGAFVGSRLGYCVFYNPELFFQFKNSPPFWGVLALQEGGQSAFGAIIGIVVVCFWFAGRAGVTRLYLFDLAGLCLPLSFL